jgi:hypothetical protein
MGMKAIVLSCDKYHPVADHMVTSYQEHWPSNPFTFRIPFQSDRRTLKDKHGDKVELWETPLEIKPTVLSLLSDLEDDEWVYWCIDDKYLVDVDETAGNAAYSWAKDINDTVVQGIMFSRCRNLLEEENLRADTSIRIAEGYEYTERRNYYQFWIHQFLRVGIIRELFQEFPDHDFVPKEMDAWMGQNPGQAIKEFKNEQKMYVSRENFARFGESSSWGAITQNCVDSMARYGLKLPDTFNTTHHEIFMGEYP